MLTTSSLHSVRGSAKVIILVIVGILVVIGALVAGVAWMIFGAIQDFPDDARPEAVLAGRMEFVTAVEEALAVATDRKEAVLALESIPVPEDLLYLAYEPSDAADDGGVRAGLDEDEDVVIVQVVEWSSSSHMVMNGTGHGTLGTSEGKKSILIINRSVSNSKVATGWKAFFPRFEGE